MSLGLTSTNKDLNTLIQESLSDQAVSALEFQKIRDQADRKLQGASDNDPSGQLKQPLARFQSIADELSETLQLLTKNIRESKPDAAQLAELREAVEHQLAYVIRTYGATLDRYIKTAR